MEPHLAKVVLGWPEFVLDSLNMDPLLVHVVPSWSAFVLVSLNMDPLLVKVVPSCWKMDHVPLRTARYRVTRDQRTVV